MKFWSRISELLRNLPAEDKTFVESAWISMSRISGQLRFEVQNAISSLSPEYIPIYRIQYWKKYESPWTVNALVYSIPKLRDNAFGETYIEYKEGIDYNISSEKIVWVSLGPTDGDMEAANVDAWTQIGVPATFEKNTTEQYAGVRCLKIVGNAGEGVKSSSVVVNTEDWVRYSVYAKCTTGYVLELWDEDNGTKIAEFTDLSGVDYTEREIVAKTPVGCTHLTLRVILTASGTLYLDNMDLTRYPQDAYAFAEQVLSYNPYLDTKLGYELRFRGINTSGYSPIHAHHIIRALNYAYRSSDTFFAMHVGITAILGLPFAYVAGTIAKKETSGDNHIITIVDSSNVEHIIEVDSSLCELTDFPDVGVAVKEFEPLIPDALKDSKIGTDGFIPSTYLDYPADGDMELYVENPTADPVASAVAGGTFFIGTNAADNKGFDASIGDWVQGSGGVLESIGGGQTGNGGRYTVTASPSTTLPYLSAGLNDLEIGKEYCISYYLKYETAWSGGDVTLTIDGQTLVHTPTTSFVKKTLTFTAIGTNPTITLTCANIPTVNDILWIDTFELSLAERTYYIKFTYVDAGGETLSSSQVSQLVPVNHLLKVTSPIAQENATGWNVYVSEISDSETKQNAVSIAINIDWTEPIDGLINGSALPTENNTGLTNWAAINGAEIIKNDVEEYEGIRCLKVTTDAVDEGVKPVAVKAVIADNEYFFSFRIKSDSTDPAIVRVLVVDSDTSEEIISEWFGDTTYEYGILRFIVPVGCNNIAIKFITLKSGVFYIDILNFNHIEEIQSYWADKISDSVTASLTIAAAERAGTEDLIFKAASHIYGEDGNYISIVIVASGVDQALTSDISGFGKDGDPYIYTITTGTQASQSSNSAIRDFVNSDPNAIGIIICQSNDDETADPTYSLVQTPLAGGINAKIGVYPSIPYVVGDTIYVKNLSRGTVETVKITAIESGDAPYTKYLKISKDLTEIYESPETGTSTSVGEGFLTDNTKSWAVDEHKNNKLIDSGGNPFKIESNDSTTLIVTGTPAAGAYRIVKDHVVVIYGERYADYTTELKIYNRFQTTYSQNNIDTFIQNIGDQGHQLTFIDIS